VLTGPVYTEAGTLGLDHYFKARRFVFFTASPLPTVLITGNGGKSYNINGVINGRPPL
jgi:hypothetical protein